ncbi:hypothetical protein HYW44_01200 [Candidatus Daviesbacteria bacterium]|nr:hypothetical protein [Candidatus Daviesbacteria bacterium]
MRNNDREPKFSEVWRQLVPENLAPDKQIIYVTDLALRKALVHGDPADKCFLPIAGLFPDIEIINRNC